MSDSHEISQTGVRELLGIVLLTCGLLMILSLISYRWQDILMLRYLPNDPPANYIGPVGAWFGFIVFMVFGVASVLLPIGCGLIGIFLLFQPKQAVKFRVLWCIIATIAVSGLLQLYPDRWKTVCERLNIFSMPGGMLGWVVTEKGLRLLLGTTGAVILLTGLLAGCLFMFIGRKNVRSFFGWIAVLLTRAKSIVVATLEARRDKLERIARESRNIEKQRAGIEKSISRERKFARAYEAEVGLGAAADSKRKEADILLPNNNRVLSGPARKTDQALPSAPEKKTASKPSAGGDLIAKTSMTEDAGDFASYTLPPLDLLDPLPSARDRKIEGDVQTTSRILKETLAEFGIESEVTNIEQGPVVTRYELLPAPGVRVEKIAQLSNNLALTLKATSVRVQAPVPGKGVVGIEVPNAIASKVYLREILESETWRADRAEIPLILGKDVAGNDLVADLASMPHLLIAGSTGSGKTVCINSILAGLLMARTPSDLKMMLVDPKIVEFAVYNNLPHLVAPVITDPKKVPLGLRWAIGEMEKRYKLFARAGVRTIQGYNSKPKSNMESADGEDEPMPAHIPYIVIVIDELADLMSTAQADIENYIARLAQLSRAVGIHMILATQRPSVNVITGTIKANFPARVSFQVAQKVDSRTILDTGGADKLLGRGDMLILPPGSSKLLRAQGAMTTDEDIHAIVSFIKERSKPNYEVSIKTTIEKSSSGDDDFEDNGEDEELLNTAIGIIRDSKRASVSMLQRRMKIGYNRAGRLMDVLEDRGIVGPAHGSDPREILIDLDGDMPQNSNSEQEGF